MMEQFTLSIFFLMDFILTHFVIQKRRQKFSSKRSNYEGWISTDQNILSVE